jgi:hypothetical protein
MQREPAAAPGPAIEDAPRAGIDIGLPEGNLRPSHEQRA